VRQPRKRQESCDDDCRCTHAKWVRLYVLDLRSAEGGRHEILRVQTSWSAPMTCASKSSSPRP